MATFEVVGDQESVQVEGDNWLIALGASLGFFGLDPTGISRLSINFQPGGGVAVHDPISGRRFELSPVSDALPAPRLRMRLDAMRSSAQVVSPTPFPPLQMPRSQLKPPAAPAAPPLPSSLLHGVRSVVPRGASFEPPVASPPPQLARSPAGPPSWDIAAAISMVPLDAAPEPDRPEELHEQLFELSMDIAGAPSIQRACEEALTILRGLIPAESGATLYAGFNDIEFSFQAAFGPAADQVRSMHIPVDAGLAGFCHGAGLALMVQDVARDNRHDPSIDQKVGYTTRSVIAASIRDVEGTSFGCLELINAPARFSDWQLEASQVIGRMLGDFVSARQ